MNRISLALLVALLAAVATLSAWASQATPEARQDPPEPAQETVHQSGFILALGSMDAFESAMIEALGESGGEEPSVIIVPHASDAPDRGQAAKKAFQSIGMQGAHILDRLDGESTIALLAGAQVIWFSDGDPSLLMKRLAADALASRFHQWRVKGALIGGSGRVAGVLGMTYVEGHITPPPMTHLSVRPVRGLGLWQGMVVADALSEDRLSKAISATLDQPRLIGLCFDSGAAIRILGDEMYVTSNGPCILVDARKAKKTFIDKETMHSVRGAKLHSLAIGETFNWFE